MRLDQGRGPTYVTVTFCDQPEHERSNHEQRYSSFGRRETESLPHFTEFETPVLVNH
jgi:hypothetical protein